MSLFFYGAIQADQASPHINDVLQRIAKDLQWNLSILEQQTVDTNPIYIALGLDETSAKQAVIFELKDNTTTHEDVYEQLYRNYSGIAMISHYRQVAYELDHSNWQHIEFAESDEVNKAYIEKPANIPVITFATSICKELPSTTIIFCIDQDFDNQFGCAEILGDTGKIVNAIWATIAFGYTWSNIRFKRF